MGRLPRMGGCPGSAGPPEPGGAERGLLRGAARERRREACLTRRSDGELFWRISHGDDVMPSFETPFGFSAEDRWHLSELRAPPGEVRLHDLEPPPGC